MNQETVLITGASSGIGRHLATEFAKHGHPTIVTAPVEAELQSLVAELSQKHGVSVRYVAHDLRDPQAPQQIFDALRAEGTAIDILVNNAGFGYRAHFWEEPSAKDNDLIHVNIVALLALTKLFLEPMRVRRAGRILNTASIAGFMPGPLMAVYHASKAFVLSFSEALATELKDSGVTVTALCPGATDTDFFTKAGSENSTIFQKGNLMSPQEVAAAGYAAVMKGERVHVAGGLNQMLTFMRRLSPDSALAAAMEKSYSDVPLEDVKRHRGDVEQAAASRAE